MKLQVLVNKDCPNKITICKPAKSGDAGFDLVSWIDTKTGKVTIYPHTMVNIRTGMSIKIPRGYWGDIRPRSSTFMKKHLLVMNSVIDEGYVGEISYVVWNPSSNSICINNGDRVAQLVILPRITPSIRYVNRLPNTSRSNAGFGSTGV